MNTGTCNQSENVFKLRAALKGHGVPYTLPSDGRLLDLLYETSGDIAAAAELYLTQGPFVLVPDSDDALPYVTGPFDTVAECEQQIRITGHLPGQYKIMPLRDEHGFAPAWRMRRALDHLRRLADEEQITGQPGSDAARRLNALLDELDFELRRVSV